MSAHAADFLPSRDLAQLGGRSSLRPSLSQVEVGLHRIAKALGVAAEQEIFVPSCHVADQEAQQGEQEPAEDTDEDDSGNEFELRMVRNWLTKIVATDLEWLSTDADVEGDDRRELAVSRAAELLAVCAGKSASGPSRVRYLFETSGGDKVSVRSQEASLTNDALGGRTWGAAPLLARHLLNDPETSRLFQSPASSGDPIRLLELGAGTGLVGFALAQLHHSLTGPRRDLHLVLTDHHPNVLANLAATTALNGIGVDSMRCVVQIRKLDWQAVYETQQGTREPSGYSSTAQTLPEQADAAMDPAWLAPIPFEDRSVDILIAADCVYDPLHPFWIRAVADKYLSKGDAGGTSAQGILHMISPVRSTHKAEMAAMYSAFPRADGQDEESRLADFVMVKEEILHGYDEFGPPRLKLGEKARQAMTMTGTKTEYRRFEIQRQSR
ncbi:hypothetical protein V8E36_001834 [Tilletia maclaganii]